jgi:YD repeat-containing protein
MPQITGIKTKADVELQQVWDQDGAVTAETDPDLIPMVQHYKHFDLSDEQLGRTRRYNCWGFTFLPRRYWINSSSDVDQIINDNCVPVALGSLRPGDVIRYRDASNITTHTGRVWEVDAAGNCIKVRSKWGSMGEYVHIPLHLYITPFYGTNLAYFRQIAPLKGLGDLWIRDAGDDSGEQYSNSLWASPDILVDVPPYGSVDVNPAFGQVNRVSVVVHNRSNTDIANTRARYYWADPHAGFAPSNWQLIPGTAGQPNPTNTFTVPANSSAQAPYVEWVPTPVPGVSDPAHQCLLAIAFVNDDPKDSANPNPLVYPFNIRWENNVAARNVHIVTLKKGAKAKLQLAVAMPFDGVERLTADLSVRLAFVPRLPIFGFPPKVVLPRVQITLGERRPFSLQAAKHVAPFGKVWGPLVQPRDADFELLKGWGEKTFLPDMTEKTVAWKQVKRIPIAAKESIPLCIEIAAPDEVQPGTNFYLRIEQEVRGDVTGCYTVVISII